MTSQKYTPQIHSILEKNKSQYLAFKQAKTLRKLASHGGIGTALLIALIGFGITRNHIHFSVLWMASSLAALLFYYFILFHLTKPNSDKQFTYYNWLLSIAVFTLSALLSLPAFFLTSDLPEESKTFLLIIYKATLSTGTCLLSIIWKAAMAWTIGLIPAIAYLVFEQFRSYTLLAEVLLCMYVVINISTTLYLSSIFRKRCLAEISADEQRSIVKLLLHEFEDGSEDWLWEIDKHGNLTHISPRFSEYVKISIEDLKGISLKMLLQKILPDNNNLLKGEYSSNELMQMHNTRKPYRGLKISVMINGEKRHWISSGTPFTDAHGNYAGWRGVSSDCTERMRQQEEIERLANTDTLTGLANRHHFNHTLKNALNTHGKNNSLYIGILDLDKFKAINDSLGHSAGDQFLAAAASRLVQVAQANELCARLGGDEFAIALFDNLTRKQAEIRFEKFLESLRQPFTEDLACIEITSSLGYAVYPDDAQTAESLMKFADLALYAAKGTGRNKFIAYDTRFHQNAHKDASIQIALGRALAQKEMELHYQPQVDISSNQVVCFEALLRWFDSEKNEYINPVDFISIAEKIGAIVSIGQWAIINACKEAALWPTHIGLAVNISPLQLLSDDIVTVVQNALASSGLNANRLTLEITESRLLDSSAIKTIKKLHQLGVHFAIDDFGTGYSSFSILQSLPLSQLKIDRSFILSLNNDNPTEAQTIVKSIIQIALALGLEPVAEGVETIQQKQLLHSFGCMQIQGFLESSAMPGSQVLPYLELRSNNLK